MRFDRRLFIIGLLILTTTMVIASQFAVTKLGYEFHIVHPSNGNLRLIGSDNASDGLRLLRVRGMNGTNASVELILGNITTNQRITYTAAFGIVNEEKFPVNITRINVTSSNWTFMTIWLHGDRDADASWNTSNSTSLLMWNNGTVLNASNITAWTLAPGNENASDMCSNVSDRTNHSCRTTWDGTTHVRFSENNTDATSQISDFVWVQITIELLDKVDVNCPHIGTIFIQFEAEKFS